MHIGGCKELWGGRGIKESGCGYKRPTRETPAVMEMLRILTVSDSIDVSILPAVRLYQSAGGAAAGETE